jgi:AcrR family transcriptional regulator
MSKTKEQNEAIRAEKRQLILEVAMRLFAEEGYERTSVDKIAKEAGFSKGLMYNYFKSKDDLLKEIFKTGVQKVSEEGIYQQEITDKSLVQDLERTCDLVVEHRHFFTLYTAITTQPGIAQKLGNEINKNRERSLLADYFKKRFGADATKELFLYTMIVKGYCVLALYSSGQELLSPDLLKETVIDFAKQRYGE